MFSTGSRPLTNRPIVSHSPSVRPHRIKDLLKWKIVPNNNHSMAMNAEKPWKEGMHVLFK